MMALGALIPLVIGLLSLIVTIIALVDAVRVPSDSDYRAGTKLIWVLVIIFFGCLGAIIYYAVGRPQRR
jgi:hypothetical protein